MNKKPQIVVFVNRAIGSKFNKSLIEQMKFLEIYKDDFELVYVTEKKSKMGENFIYDVTGLQFDQSIHLDKLYMRDIQSKKYKSYKEFAQKVDWYPNLTNVKHIIMFGGLLSAASNMQRSKNGLNEKIYGSQSHMNFQAIGKPVSVTCSLMALAKREHAVFHEICYDTQENSLDLLDECPEKYFLYHGYDFPEYNMQRLDSLQYWIKHNAQSALFDPIKKYDIVFGYTALTRDRETIYDKVSEFLNKFKKYNIKVFVRHKRLDIDTFINRDEYLTYISKSRFTLCIPPYDPKQLSVYRFIESIDKDCLPLIGDDCYAEDFYKSFNIDTNIVKPLLHKYQPDNLINDDLREDLIKYLKDKLFPQDLKLLNISIDKPTEV